jgi:hypothetical protein
MSHELFMTTTIYFSVTVDIWVMREGVLHQHGLPTMNVLSMQRHAAIKTHIFFYICIICKFCHLMYIKFVRIIRNMIRLKFCFFSYLTFKNCVQNIFIVILPLTNKKTIKALLLYFKLL